MTARESSSPVRSRVSLGDRSVVLLVAAAVLVVGVVGAVLVFGVERPPQVDALGDRPDRVPSAAVAWTAMRSDGTCLRIAWPDGETTDPWCERDGGDLIGWTEEGLLLRRWGADGRVHVIDPRTGGTLERLDDERVERVDNRHGVWTEHRDGVLVVRLSEDDTVLWQVPSSDRYDIRDAATSADGRWVAMVDTANRLLVAPSDGSVAPREWARGVGGWRAPVWQGTTATGEPAHPS